MRHLRARLFSMFLRGAALAGKLVVFIALARHLGSDELGLYGLVAASVGYGTFIAGMEYYNYSVREVAGHSVSEQSRAIANHAVFVALAQSVLVLAVLLAWIAGLFSFPLTLIALAVTVLEQWAQEGYRLLVASSRPVAASVALFLRQGAWVFVVIFGLALFPELRSLNFVLYCWLAGAGLSALIAAVALLRQIGLPKADMIDRHWIRRGLPVSLIFLGAAFGLQTINFLDRFLQARFGDEKALAAYVLFFGITVALNAVLDAGVFSFGLPRIIASGRQSLSKLAVELRAIILPMLVVNGLFALAAVVFFHFCLDPLGIGEYRAYPSIFYLLLASVTLHAWSTVPHLGLYAMHREKIVLSGHLLSLLVFVGIAVALRGWHDGAVAFARTAAFGFLLVWKTLFFILLQRKT